MQSTGVSRERFDPVTTCPEERERLERALDVIRPRSAPPDALYASKVRWLAWAAWKISALQKFQAALREVRSPPTAAPADGPDTGPAKPAGPGPPGPQPPPAGGAPLQSPPA